MSIYENIINSTALFFGAETPLRTAAMHEGYSYEERPQQREMAISVAESLASKVNLCVEAPTGVGKSLAYLVPSIFYSFSKLKPVIISTETIHLQEQLFHKDIPLLKRLIGRKFSACVAKGRSNYLCKRRLEQTLGQNRCEYVPSNVLQAEIKGIWSWSKKTIDGSLGSLDFKPSAYTWQCVCCEAMNCKTKKCKYYSKCFYWNARQAWGNSNIIITNHSMFFSDMKVKLSGKSECGIFPEYCAVILDEAHQLENSAAKHLGAEVSEHGIYNLLNRMFNPATSRGLLARTGRDTLELRDMIVSAFDKLKVFFNSVRQFTLFEYNADSDDNEHGNKKRIRESCFIEDSITPILSKIIGKLSQYIKLQYDDDFRMELELQLILFNGINQVLKDAVNMANPDGVYWTEIKSYGRKRSASISYAPLNVAEILRNYLFSSDRPIILASATLSVNNNLEYYAGRIGFKGKGKILSSPYDHEKQMSVYIPIDIMEPSHKNYDNILAENIKKYIELTNGKALVLFTGNNMLMRIKALTEDFFAQKGIKLLSQSDGMNRSQMINIFKMDVNSVLFGVDSFWTGVDIPGETLSNVIITKLPFAVHKEPIIEARHELIIKNGGESFRDYTLPEAILKFRQGVGRLIRSKKDKGIVVILDS